MKNLILIFFVLVIVSCSSRTERKFQLPDNKTQEVYQKIRIINVEVVREYSSKNKNYYIITIVKSNNDTSEVYSRNVFYRGEYWAETIEDDQGKILSLLQTDPYETVKLTDIK